MIVAPKSPLVNANYRMAIIKRAVGDRDFQRQCWVNSARDIIWWIDTFAMTYSPKDFPEHPVRPFVTYPVQELAVKKLDYAIGRNDILMEKSRDMGASWMCMLVFTHRWLFKERQSFLMGSRKEELVDKAGDSKTLFWKIDFLLEHIPGWMRPQFERRSMHLENLENKSCIDGESTNGDFGVGDRRTAILLDEFAKVRDRGHAVLSGTQQVTKCRIFNSTPEGAAGAYYDARQNMPTENILRLHWTDHPERRKGLYTTDTGKNGGRLVILDKEYKYPDDYKFDLAPTKGRFPRSPYYDNECRRAPNGQIIAQDLDIDYAGSAWRFFDNDTISRLEKEYCRPPVLRGELTFDEYGTNPKFVENEHGRLLLWQKPAEYSSWPNGRKYTLGADISAGTDGEYSSQSAAAIVDEATGEKVAQFAVRTLNPSSFCDYTLALCNWFNQAFLIFEKNGTVGAEYHARLKKSPYRNLYYRGKEKDLSREKTKQAGWHSDPETKRILLSQYGTALAEGNYINRSADAVRECGEYVCLPDGTIEHNRVRGTIDPNAAGANHGDLVIADALASHGRTERHESTSVPQPSDHYPTNSYMGRRREYEKQTQFGDIW